MAGHALAGKHAGRKRRCADRTLHLEHVAVRLRTASKMMATNHTGEPTALRGAAYVDKLFIGEDVDHNPVARLHRGIVAFLGSLDRDLLHHADGRHVRLGKMARHRLVHLRSLDEVHIADLGGVVAILRLRLQLRDDAGAGLQYGHRVNVAAVVEKLGHADLLAEYSCHCHLLFLSSSCRAKAAALPVALNRIGICHLADLLTCQLAALLLLHRLDLDVDTRRQVELHQRVHRLLGRLENIDQPLVRANLERLARLLVHVRRTQHAVLVLHGRQRDREEDTFGINASDTLMSAWKNLTGTIFAVTIGLVAVFMVVGGIVIMNIMLASVTERTHEIGIRKSLGARRRDILWQFVFESGMMASMGGIAGVLLSVLIARVVNMFFTAEVPLSAVALGVGLSASVGRFFGIYPAKQAARLEPIEALRSEN